MDYLPYVPISSISSPKTLQQKCWRPFLAFPGLPVPVTHSTLLSCCSEWRPHLTGRRMALSTSSAAPGATAALAALCHGATVVDAGKVEVLVEEKDGWMTFRI